MDHWIAAALVPLATWVLLSGVDDLFLDLVFCWQWLRRHLLLLDDFRWPSESDLDRLPHKRIAIFVPLWHEQDVIGKMLEHNAAAVAYDRYDFFVGIYPNDPATLAAVEELQARHANIRVALCPHDGPTSKADCMNWIYQRMLLYEQEHGQRFEIVVTHDAEDLIHPESLRLINHFARSYDMVQVPVLALATPARELTHGLYCDDFAEFQTKDIPVRQFLGGFIPSNGVGTGYSRAVLEKLAAAHQNRVFEPSCLTEDYENGYRIHALGCRQVFLPIHRLRGTLAATREYFPRTFRAALKQRTRWTMGISLQSWERHGWRAPRRQLYWFWRDRKGLVGNLVTPLANLFFLYGAVTWFPSARQGRAWPLGIAQNPAIARLLLWTLLLTFGRLTMRGCCVARIYGVGFALGVPARAIWGNCLNGLATTLAIARYFAARLRHQPLVWLKTEHSYPGRFALMGHKRKLGEILVACGSADGTLLQNALGFKPSGERLGEYLVRMGLLDERALYEALSLQQNIPLGVPGALPILRRVTRALPARISRKWKLLPFRVADGQLFVAGPELPSDVMTRELRRFTRLDVRFHLITPTEFDRLAREYLPS